MCIWRQCNKDPSAALGMTVLGERIGSQGWCAACLEDGILVSQPSPLREGAPQGRMGQTWYERQLGSGFPVTSHKSLHNTKERISSHAWYEILRLSPHLFWLGFFSHRAFSSAQDDDTGGERVVSRGGGFAAFFYWAMPESGIQVTGYQS